MMSCGGKADFFGQDAIGARADLELALDGVRLAVLIEGHDHDGRAVTADQPRLLVEFLLAFLEADGIDDALALNAL